MMNLHRKSQNRGGRHYFQCVELFVVYTVFFCWSWGPYIQQHIPSVLFPLGLAKDIDISFMYDLYLAPANAVLVGSLGAPGTLSSLAASLFVRPALLSPQVRGSVLPGEISHGSNLIGMGLLGLGIALVVFRSASYRRRFTFGFLYFFIGLGYTPAAICKLVATGIT